MKQRKAVLGIIGVILLAVTATREPMIKARMRTTTAVMTSVLAASVVLLGTALPASAAPSPRPLSTSVVAQGRVLAQGKPVAGARVSLWAWAPTSVLMNLHPGQGGSARLIGSALTSSEGSYTVNAISAAALRAQAAPDGIVNFTVVAQSRLGVSAWSFPRRLVQTSGGMSLAAASSDGVSHPGDPQKNTLRLAGKGVPDVVPCGWVYLKSYGPQWTSVGVTYAKVTGVTQHFTYRVGQSSSLGVGQSSTGQAGSFSESGTNSASSSTSESYPTFGGDQSWRYRTQFVQGEWGYTCGTGIITYQVRTSSYAGGADYGSWPAPSANKCVIQYAGTTFTKDSTAAYHWSAGFTIPVINLSLSAQTGYDSDAEITYHFSVKHALCGTNDYPGGTPKLIVAGNPSS